MAMGRSYMLTMGKIITVTVTMKILGIVKLAVTVTMAVRDCGGAMLLFG